MFLACNFINDLDNIKVGKDTYQHFYFIYGEPEIQGRVTGRFF